MIGYIVGMLLLCCAVINIRCEQIKAERDIAQAQFQKVLVLKSKAYDKSKVQDRIKH